MKNKTLLLIGMVANALCANFWFDIVPLQTLLLNNPQIGYQKCFDSIAFSYKPFPLSINPANHPNQGNFKETYILTIRNGQVQGYGMVLVDNQYIQELIWKGWQHNLAQVQKFENAQICYVPGRVVVLGQPAFTNYFHWLTETLGRLALLEMSGVEYDYLYVPCCNHFMIETLQLWGIDLNKVIIAQQNVCLQAEKLIVPSMVSNLDIPAPLFSCYVQPHLLEYVKNKLLNAALQHQPTVALSAQVFVSRKDAPQRKILNESAVFDLFQKQGFVSYELDKLSVIDQILLFHNAKIVVAAQGTGLANSIFCKPDTKIIELFQGLNDCTFWYLSQDLHLNYTPIKTTEFLTDYYQAWATDTYMPLLVLKQCIQKYL